MNDLTTYEAVKDQMRTGDGIGYYSHSIIGRIIAWRTKHYGPILHSHWGGIIRLPSVEDDGKRRFTMEATETGFQLRLFSSVLATYKGEVWWYPLKDEFNSRQEEIKKDAFSLLGKKYDWLSLFKQALFSVSTDARRLFCSEAWQIIYGVYGKALPPSGMHSLGIFKPPIKLI